MERLTFRGHKNQAVLRGMACNYSSVSFDCQLEEGRELLKLALEKLADYEDAEEQGLLLRLPCKVGTPVYYVQKCTCPYSCEECGASRWLDNCYCDYKARIFEREFNYSHLNAFGKTVFLTKEEAEKELERLNGNG